MLIGSIIGLGTLIAAIQVAPWVKQQPWCPSWFAPKKGGD